MRIITILFIGLLISTASSTQDLSGTWEGKGLFIDYAKICIIRYDNTYIGYTYDEGMGYCKANFIGRFDSIKKKLKGVNDGFIEKTVFHSQSRYNLTYVIIDSHEYLKGIVTAKTVGAKIMSFGLPMSVTYTRISNHVDTTEFIKKWMADKMLITENSDQQDKNYLVQNSDSAILFDSEDISAIENILVQQQIRKNDTVSVITTKEKELRLKILDNGIEDGDTISIIHNKKVLINKEIVSAKGITLTIPIDNTDPYHEIVLIANNLGTIPPNTALVIIDAGQKRYRLTASTDLSKNAMIIFKYEE